MTDALCCVPCHLPNRAMCWAPWRRRPIARLFGKGVFTHLAGNILAPVQVLVDVFVNYDCSLQASNLFERTIKALTRVAAWAEGAAPVTAPAPAVAKMKSTALKASARPWFMVL